MVYVPIQVTTANGDKSRCVDHPSLISQRSVALELS